MTNSQAITNCHTKKRHQSLQIIGIHQKLICLYFLHSHSISGLVNIPRITVCQGSTRRKWEYIIYAIAMTFKKYKSHVLWSFYNFSNHKFKMFYFNLQYKDVNYYGPSFCVGFGFDYNNRFNSKSNCYPIV